MGISYFYAAQAGDRKRRICFYVRGNRQGFTPKHFYFPWVFLYSRVSQNQIRLFHPNHDDLRSSHRNPPGRNALWSVSRAFRFSCRYGRRLNRLLHLQKITAYYYIVRFFHFGGSLARAYLKCCTNFPAARVGLYATIPRAWAKNPPLAPGFPLRSLPQIRISIRKIVLNHLFHIKWITLDNA